MRGVLLISFLLILMMSGLDSTGAHRNRTSYSPPQQGLKIQAIQASSADYKAPVLRDEGLVIKISYLTRDDVEDERINNIFPRKFKLFLRNNFSLPEAIHLNFLYASIKERATVRIETPGFYITQRALRI
jgi:hypothetical protein